MIPELRVEVPAACQKGIRFCNGFPAEEIPHAFSLFRFLSVRRLYGKGVQVVPRKVRDLMRQ